MPWPSAHQYSARRYYGYTFWSVCSFHSSTVSGATYHLIGEAYIDRVMDGELSRGDTQTESYELA